MKKLYVVRHAKSSWSNPDLSDFDRPLNRRGERDAPRMGRFLNAQGVHPDRLVSSPAARALATAKLIAAEIGYPAKKIDRESRFYGAGVHDTMNIVQSFPDGWATAMIFGHNPTTTSFINLLADAHIDNVPTCGVAEIQLHADTWGELGQANCELAAYYIPKKLPS